MWDFTGAVEGTCINTTAFFYCEYLFHPFPFPFVAPSLSNPLIPSSILTPPTVTSGFNILTDLWILLLPISTLRGINRPTREKIALFLIFGVGTFAAVASIVRLHTIYTYTLADDPFHEGIKVNLWSVIELTIAISCASVSALKPIFSGRQRKLTRGARRGRGGGYSYGSYGTGTWSRVDNTGKGTVSGSGGSRSTGTWLTKKSKGSNGGLGTQSSEDGLHGEEEAELQTLGSHADSHADDQAAEKEREKELTPAHKEYRRWAHSSHTRLGSRDGQQPHHTRQHSRQQSTSLSSPNGQNLPTPDGSTADSASLPIQRPKPAAIAINQTRPLSPPPPPLSPSHMAHFGYQGPGQQQQYEAQVGNSQEPGRWVEVETAATRTVYTQGGEVRITPLHRPGGGGARGRKMERGMSVSESKGQPQGQGSVWSGQRQGQEGMGIWAGQEVRQEVNNEWPGMVKRASSSESLLVLQK